MLAETCGMQFKHVSVFFKNVLPVYKVFCGFSSPPFIALNFSTFKVLTFTHQQADISSKTVY